MDNQTPMFEELPMDNPDALKKQAKPINNMQEQFLELLNKKGCSLADIHRETQIPWGTLYGWYKGDVKAQFADRNLLELAKFFNVTIDYLCFGIGNDEPYYEKIGDAS